MIAYDTSMDASKSWGPIALDTTAGRGQHLHPALGDQHDISIHGDGDVRRTSDAELHAIQRQELNVGAEVFSLTVKGWGSVCPSALVSPAEGFHE